MRANLTASIGHEGTTVGGEGRASLGKFSDTGGYLEARRGRLIQVVECGDVRRRGEIVF